MAGSGASRRSTAQAAIDAVIDRYSALSDAPDAFREALALPLPVTFWTNTRRIESDNLNGLLDAEGFSTEPVAWRRGAFRLPHAARPGQSWLHRAGLLQIQEEAAMLAVRLLDPQPGERILDLCAAPGNKTAEIAVALGHSGAVVANDASPGRLTALQASVARLGLTNVTSTICDGRHFPPDAGPFDRVLADVPCSGEGTIRKGFGEHRPVSAQWRRQLVGVQTALLRRAVALCRPGGRIVYSTCTFAPEENEGIVDAVLADHSGTLEVTPARFPGLDSAPGLTGWQGRAFNPTLRGALRLWPQRTGTGGFFAAVLRKSGSSPPVRTAFPAEDSAALHILSDIAARHAVAESALSRLHPLRTGGKLRLLAADPALPEGLQRHASGFFLTIEKSAEPKLSTEAAMLLGPHAERNVIDIDRAERDRYVAREDIFPVPDRLRACDGRGYVILRHRGFGLGVGWLRTEGDTGRVESLFPRRWG